MGNEDREKRPIIHIDGSGAAATTGGVAGGEGAFVAGGNISFKDCTFVLPDGSTVQGKSWLYTQGIRPPTDPNNIFGRQRELDEIDKLFKQCTALAITGFRGTGKSTLASMYLDIIEKRGEYAGIYWRRMDETIDISDVVGSFCTAIGKPVKNLGDYKVKDKLALLFRELDAKPYFLVFDNFEILLDPQTNAPLMAGFSDIIEKANENIRSRILFTSWECPASERGIRPKCYSIGGLDDSAAVQLLRKRDLTEPEDELKKAVKLAGGHPLALILLVQLVEEGAETLSDVLTDDTLWIGEKGEVAEKILDKVYNERLSEEERKLLQYVSLYREQIPLKAIVSVAHDPTWTEAFVKKTALDLTRKSLLYKTGENYREESLIHSYAYGKLIKTTLPTLPELHLKAAEYYKNIDALAALYHLNESGDSEAFVKFLASVTLQITNKYIWLPKEYTLPLKISLDVTCMNNDDEFLPCFSKTKAQWGYSDCDALSWYLSPHRDDFTFRTKLFGEFPKVERHQPRLKAVVGKKYRIICEIMEKSATYNIDGDKYASATYNSGTVPTAGYFGFAVYRTEDIKIENIDITPLQ